ncbi:RNA recognition motif [Leishmania braziliensis]|nr:RNA recognition motif [Leishmania braziliensis]
MGKRDLQKEKQLELATIWGSEVQGDARFPKRRGASQKKDVGLMADSGDADSDALSEIGSDARSITSKHSDTATKERRKAAKKKRTCYRLHCFVEPGTELNAVRTVFEAYEPKIEIRTAQKGNLLNKSQFAVLTFRNKAMALHAVKTLDGTNQRDMLGVTNLKLNLMLTRQQSKIARKKLSRKIRHEKQQNQLMEDQEDMAFIRNFLKQQSSAKGK